MSTGNKKHIFADVQKNPLKPDDAFRFVNHEEAGAVNIFTGTTRNHHDGKTVLELYYDCYEAMAVKELRKIAEKMLIKHHLIRIWLVHRTGLVPVGEASIVLAVSAAHRKEAFAAVAETMELIKQDVPIWKKETFENETLWKEEKIVKEK
jgi:molybdopterin synthase catalytic subunit